MPGSWQEKRGEKPPYSVATLPSSWGHGLKGGQKGNRGATKLTEPSQGWQAPQSPCLWVTGRSAAQLQPPRSALEPRGHREGTPPWPFPDSEGSDFSSEARHVTDCSHQGGQARSLQTVSLSWALSSPGDRHDWGAVGTWGVEAGACNAGPAPLPPTKLSVEPRASNRPGRDLPDVPLVWGGGLLPSGCLLGPLRECTRCSAHAAQFVCPLPTPVGSNISPRPSGPAGEGWRNTQFYSEAWRES